MERKLTTHFSFFVDQLQSILDVFDTFETILLKFLLLIYSYLVEKTITRQVLEKYIDSIAEIQLSPLSELLTQRLAQFEQLIL